MFKVQLTGWQCAFIAMFAVTGFVDGLESVGKFTLAFQNGWQTSTLEVDCKDAERMEGSK